MALDEQIKTELSKKLSPANIKKRDKGGMSLSYIEGWFAEEEANNIFGYDGWNTVVISLTENTPPTQNAKGNWIVSFRAHVRVEALGATRDGIGFGSGIAKDIHDAYEGAIKEAQTDAEKRALKTFGNRFGLALYDKQQNGVEKEDKKPKQAAKLTPEQEAVRKEIAGIISSIRACTDPVDVSDLIHNNIAKINTFSDAQKAYINKEAADHREKLVGGMVNGHAV